MTGLPSDDAAFLAAAGIDAQSLGAADGDRVASIMSRAFARSIDLLVVALLSLAFTVPFVSPTGSDVPRWVQLASLASWLVYEAGTVAVLGCTMGKMAMGLMVVDVTTGGAPGIGRSLVRAAVVPALIPLVSFFALLAYPTATVDLQARRGLLDRLAGTAVVAARR